MLANGDYPYPLKQRISGKFGHLDNDAAAGLLSRLDNSRLKHLFAAHLVAAEQHARTCRRGAGRGAQLRPRLDRHCRSARRLRLARIRSARQFNINARSSDGKETGTLPGQGQDRVHHGRSQSAGHALSRRHQRVRWRTGGEARAEGRDQQQDQRIHHAKARGGGRQDALRAPAQRARFAGARAQDAAGRMRRAQYLRGFDGQAPRHPGGHTRCPSRSSNSSTRAIRSRIRWSTTTTSACWGGRPPARSRK